MFGDVLDKKEAFKDYKAVSFVWEAMANLLTLISVHCPEVHPGTARKNGFKQVCNRSKYDANLAL